MFDILKNYPVVVISICIFSKRTTKIASIRTQFCANREVYVVKFYLVDLKIPFPALTTLKQQLEAKKQTANLLSLGTHICRHVVVTFVVRSLLIISSRDCREADSRDTSPRHACLGEVSRKIWLHDLAINNNGGSVPVIFISLRRSTQISRLCPFSSRRLAE